MTQEETFQELKLAYVSKTNAHIKALKHLTLEGYLETKNLVAISNLRKDSVHSAVNLSCFMVNAVADRAAWKSQSIIATY